jgi:hypothetical protein
MSENPEPGTLSPPPPAPPSPSDAGGGSGLPAPPPGETSGGVNNTATVTGGVKAENLTIVGQLNVAAEYLPPQAGGLRVFSVEQTWTVSRDHEEETAELFVGDRQALEQKADELHARRILLITGPQRSGKSTTALYLSTRMMQRRALPKATLMVDPLTPQVRVDMRKMVESREAFGGRVTVFTDAFARGNPDLLDFFRRVDRVGWEQLADTLRANQAYVVFTSEMTAVEDVRPQLDRHIAWHEVAPLERTLVLDAFERRLAWLVRQRLISEEHAHVASEGRDQIVDVLTTVPRVATFLDQFVRGDADLVGALKRFNDVDYWFSRELASDVDAWCFAFTLALAEAARPSEEIGWMEFDRLRRAIANAVKANDEFFPRRALARSPDEAGGDARAVSATLCDDSLLATCRAEIVRDAGQMADVVRFVDRAHPAAILQTILARHRRVLTTVLPAIRRVAEDGRRGSYAVRALAAEVLGRAGEIAPHAVTLPLARNEWVVASDRGMRPLVGRLLQGMRASSNENYRRAALSAIDSLTADPDVEPNRLLTAISAYAQLGVRESKVAMERLGIIAIETLAPSMSDLQQIERLAEYVERALSRTASVRSAEDLVTHRLRLGRLAQMLAKAHATTLVALERAVTYLCIVDDPVKVLRWMRDWISKGGPSTGTLVAMLFLHGGIAEELESLATGARTPGYGAIPSPFLISLASSADAVERFAGFLADVHDSIYSTFTLPSELQREFQTEFAECLRWWVRGATIHERYYETVRDLFALLATIRGGAMRNGLYALLASPEFVSDHRFRTFATDVRITISKRAESRDEEV